MKPYYIIDFSAAACLFEIRINDISVIMMEVEGQVGTIIPINLGILKSGKQVISVNIFPLLGTETLNSKAYLNFEIKLFDVTNDFVFREALEIYKSPTIEEDKKLPVLTHNSIFQAIVPYSFEGWTQGEDLKEIKEIKSKLISTYTNLGYSINNGNYDLFKQKIKNREDFMSTCMYLDKKEKNSRINELIEDFQSGFKVQPISEDVVCVFYGFNKVVTLKKRNGNQYFT